VGGIFFDDLILKDFSTSLDFCKKVMQTFAKSYFNIFMKRKNLSFGEKEKNFQNYRRGRYVEFNLVHDRGTHFGLQSGGRTESILMSMPPTANWTYNWVPQNDSKEEELYINFLQPRNWLEIKE
jgi:coproporphyrinogen III oxidase